MSEIRTNVDTDQVEQPAFYNAENLREVASVMNYLPDGGAWVENCQDCHVPMTRIGLDPTAVIMGRPDTVRGIPEDPKFQPITWSTWTMFPVVHQASQLWLCFGCRSVWTIVGSFWTKLSINGVNEVGLDQCERVLAAIPKVGGPIIEPSEVDPGEPPSPDSTKCPHCFVWRKVEPYGDAGDTIHVCPSCRTGQIVPKGEL